MKTAAPLNAPEKLHAVPAMQVSNGSATFEYRFVPADELDDAAAAEGWQVASSSTNANHHRVYLLKRARR